MQMKGLPLKIHPYQNTLFYSDIKLCEQGSGQFISKEHNKLPAMACLPLQQRRF